MKIRSGVGAQPDYVAGVLWYFRGYKCHVEGHAVYVLGNRSWRFGVGVVILPPIAW